MGRIWPTGRSLDTPAVDENVNFMSDDAVIDNVPMAECYVLDGGSLIHRLQWQNGCMTMYGAVADTYMAFSLQSYEEATVVFDGYQDSSSIRDCTDA